MSTRVRGPSTGGRNLRGFNKRIKRESEVAAIEVAKLVAVEITRQAVASYDSGRTVYGDARKKGVYGNALTLVATGDTRRDLRFVSDGTTTIRASLPEKYVKYLIGKYKILPIGNAAMPEQWWRAIDVIAERVLDERMPAAIEGAG